MCTTCASTQLFDQARSDVFGQKLIDAINGASVALMASVGHRTGLFDRMGDSQPRTSEELATETGLNERYVREWLGAMTCGRVTEFDPVSRKYHLPKEHATWLTRAATPNNFAGAMQWVAVLGGVEDKVVDAFHHGKGVPYSAYDRFNEVMAEESAQTCVAALDAHIVPMIEGLEERLRKGIDVIDVGCGSGRAMVHLAKRFPLSRFNGIDLLPTAIDAARQCVQEAGVIANTRFRAIDATTWDEAEKYDLVTTFDAIHDQARPDIVLRNIRRALRPGGVYMMQDIQGSSHVDQDMSHPMATFIYTISCMHCMSVSLANGGMGLGAAWGKELALRMLEQAGFDDVTVQTLPHDPLNFYYVCRV